MTLADGWVEIYEVGKWAGRFGKNYAVLKIQVIAKQIISQNSPDIRKNTSKRQNHFFQLCPPLTTNTGILIEIFSSLRFILDVVRLGRKGTEGNIDPEAGREFPSRQVLSAFSFPLYF